MHLIYKQTGMDRRGFYQGENLENEDQKRRK